MWSSVAGCEVPYAGESLTNNIPFPVWDAHQYAMVTSMTQSGKSFATPSSTRMRQNMGNITSLFAAHVCFVLAPQLIPRGRGSLGAFRLFRPLNNGNFGLMTPGIFWGRICCKLQVMLEGTHVHDINYTEVHEGCSPSI